MLDIITIGSATQDIFLMVNKLNVVHSSRSLTGERIYFDHGAKIEVNEAHQDTGGGGTNTAIGFAKLGLKVGYIGKLGADPVACKNCVMRM